jgi:hypothetical protein
MGKTRGERISNGMKRFVFRDGRVTSFAFGITLAFLAVGCVAAAHHELWRDEIQAWLIARDSASLPELFRHIRYDGHPGLWYVCLWFITRMTHSFSAMQAFHLAIASVTVYLFARHSPFNRIQKALFAFGYFPAFEYSVLCRNYAPGVLLLILFCRLFPQRDKKFLWISIVLFLMANTIVHMLIISMVIAAVLAFDFFIRRKTPAEKKGGPAWKWILGFTVIGTGILLSVLQVVPPHDGGFARLWKWAIDFHSLEQTINTVTRAYIPVPQMHSGFWVSPLFLEKFPLFLRFEIIFSLAMVAGTALVFLRKPVVLAFYLGGTFALWSFIYLKYFGFLRHQGLLFVLFVAATWMYWAGPLPPRPGTALTRWSATAGKLFRPAVTVLFGIHVIGAAVALPMDIRHVFSHGKTAADYIKRENMQNRLMAGHMDTNAVSVLGYLDKKTMYYPQSLRFGSFVVMNLKHNSEINDSTIVERVKAFTLRSKQNVLFIVSYPLPLTDPCIKPIAEFRGSMIRDEDFYLYDVRCPF